MKSSSFGTSLDMAKGLNQILLIISIVFLLVIAIQGFSIYHLVKNKQVILIPPVMSQSTTVSEAKPDAAYLDMMAAFLLGQKLNVTPDTVDKSFNVVKAYVSPEYSASLGDRLEQESKLIKNEKISAMFYPSSYKADVDNLKVYVTGTINKYVGKRALDPEQITYMVEFSYPNGILRLSSMKQVEVKEK